MSFSNGNQPTKLLTGGDNSEPPRKITVRQGGITTEVYVEDVEDLELEEFHSRALDVMKALVEEFTVIAEKRKEDSP